MTPITVITIAIAAGIVAIGVALYRNFARGLPMVLGVGRARWRRAVEETCARLALVHEAIEDAPDRASGRVGDIDVSVDDTWMEGGLGMQVVVSVPHVPDEMRIGRSRAARGGARGDDLGRDVVLSRAPERLAIKWQNDATLRALAAQVLRDGAVLVDGRLRIRRVEFFESGHGLSSCLIRMIELAQRLGHPEPEGRPRGIGTPLAIALRRAVREAEPARTEAVAALLAPLAAAIGDAQVLRDPAKKTIEIRTDEEDPHRTTLELSSGLSPEIRVATSGKHATFSLTCDPSDPPLAANDDVVAEHVTISGMFRDDHRRALDALPATTREALYMRLPAIGVRYFRLRDDEVWLMFWETLDTMVAPEEQLAEAVALARLVARPPDRQPRGSR